MFRYGALPRFWRSAGALRVLSRTRPYSSVHDRYAEKLAEKARAQGVTVNTLLEQSKDKSDAVRKSDVADLVEQAQLFRKHAAAKTASADVSDTDAGKPENLSETARRVASAVDGKPKLMNLDTYVDVEKLRNHNRQEIEMLWKARFVGKTNEICGAMDANVFSRLYINARKMPTFVLPLPHKTHGVELHYVQWSFVASNTIHCLFTSLAEYKLHNEYAHPHTTFMMHTDLAGDKGTVLTNTVVQNNEVPLDAAVFLTLNLQRFYAAEVSSKYGAEKIRLLREFNSGNTAFTAERLIEATETLD